MAWVSTCVRSQGAGERSCSRDLVSALVNLDMFLFHYVSIEGEAPPPPWDSNTVSLETNYNLV